MAEFQVDRRPILCVSTYGGSSAFPNTAGHVPVYYEPGGVQKLIDVMIKPMITEGFERFMVWIPAGSSGQIYGSDQWNTLPTYRQLEFRDVFGELIENNQRIEFGVYVGFNPDSVGSLSMKTETMRVPDVKNEQDQEHLRRCIKPFVDIGFRSIGFDLAGAKHNVSSAIELADAYAIDGVKVIGEAFPNNGATSGDVFDGYAATRMAWGGLDSFEFGRDVSARRLNRATTESHWIFSGHARPGGARWDTRDIYERAYRGYVPSWMPEIGQYANAKTILHAGELGSRL